MIKPRLSRKGAYFLLGALAFAAIVYAVWPRSPLRRYTSPPMTINGKTVRLSVLVPPGLVPHAQPPKTPTAKYAIPIYTDPDHRMAWLPSAIRRWLGLDAGSGSLLNVMYADRGGKKGGLVLLGGESEVGAEGITTSNNILGYQAAYLNGDWEVSYSRGDRSAFEATYREVCKSLRVLPADGE